MPDTLLICRHDLEALPHLTSQNATHAISVDWLEQIPKPNSQVLALPVHDATKVLGCSFVRGSSRFRVMAGKHLGPMSLSLCDHADIESGIQEFRGCELSQGEDRAVEFQMAPTR